MDIFLGSHHSTHQLVNTAASKSRDISCLTSVGPWLENSNETLEKYRKQRRGEVNSNTLVAGSVACAPLGSHSRGRDAAWEFQVQAEGRQWAMAQGRAFQTGL